MGSKLRSNGGTDKVQEGLREGVREGGPRRRRGHKEEVQSHHVL